jgi:hypothetical protein
MRLQQNECDDQIFIILVTYLMPRLKKTRIGLVNTVGSQGAMLFNAKRKRNASELNMTQREASVRAYSSDSDEADGL